MRKHHDPNRDKLELIEVDSDTEDIEYDDTLGSWGSLPSALQIVVLRFLSIAEVFRLTTWFPSTFKRLARSIILWKDVQKFSHSAFQVDAAISSLIPMPVVSQLEILKSQEISDNAFCDLLHIDPEELLLRCDHQPFIEPNSGVTTLIGSSTGGGMVAAAQISSVGLGEFLDLEEFLNNGNVRENLLDQLMNVLQRPLPNENNDPVPVGAMAFEMDQFQDYIRDHHTQEELKFPDPQPPANIIDIDSIPLPLPPSPCFLKKIHLRHPLFLTDASIIAISLLCPDLEVFEFCGSCPINAISSSALQHLFRLKNLKKVDISMLTRQWVGISQLLSLLEAIIDSPSILNLTQITLSKSSSLQSVLAEGRTMGINNRDNRIENLLSEFSSFENLTEKLIEVLGDDLEALTLDNFLFSDNALNMLTSKFPKLKSLHLLPYVKYDIGIPLRDRLVVFYSEFPIFHPLLKDYIIQIDLGFPNSCGLNNILNSLAFNCPDITNFILAIDYSDHATVQRAKLLNQKSNRFSEDNVIGIIEQYNMRNDFDTNRREPVCDLSESISNFASSCTKIEAFEIGPRDWVLPSSRMRNIRVPNIPLIVNSNVNCYSPLLHNLKSLCISHLSTKDFTDEGMSLLLINCKFLCEITICECPGLTGIFLSDLIHVKDTFESLRLDGTGTMANAPLSVLGKLPNLKVCVLHSVTSKCPDLLETCIEMGRNCKEIHEIFFPPQSTITIECLEALSVGSSQSINCLNMAFNSSVTNDIVLFVLNTFSNLTELVISCCNELTDALFIMMPEFSYPNIQMLNIEHCSNIGDQGAMAAVRAFPNLYFFFVSKPGRPFEVTTYEFIINNLLFLHTKENFQYTLPRSITQHLSIMNQLSIHDRRKRMITGSNLDAQRHSKHPLYPNAAFHYNTRTSTQVCKCYFQNIKEKQQSE